MRKPPLTDEERRNIMDRYARGQSLGFIALGTGRGVDTVRRVLVEARVAIRRSGGRGGGSWGWTGVTR